MSTTTIDRPGARLGEAAGGVDGPIRILHVVESFAAGTYEVVRALAPRQARAGHEVTVAYARIEGTPEDLAAEFGPDVRLLELPWHGRGPLACLRAGLALRRIEAALDPEIVHLHSTFAGLVGGLALRGPAPRIFTPHSPASASGARGTRSARRALDRLILRRSDLLGAVSAWEAEVLAPLGPRDTVVVANGIAEIDDPAGAGEQASAGRPRVIATGRITAQRRPQPTARILRAVADLAEVRWVGGESAGAATLDGVPVTGWLPREQVIEALRDATVYLHWSAWDSHPLSVLEAMACDAIVVASDIDANRDLVGEQGVCAEEGEAIELIRSLLADERLRERMLRRQRLRRQRFSASRMAERWLSVYATLLSSAPTSSPTTTLAR